MNVYSTSRIAKNRQFVLTPWLRLAIFIAWILPAAAHADQQQDPALGPVLRKALADGECFQDKFDREVWFAAMEPKLKLVVHDDNERVEILEQVQCEARRLQLPPSLVMAVIDVESRFNRWAVSPSGAVGLMQVMPFWPKQLGMDNSQLVKITHNIHIGCTILKYYLQRENGDYTRALARYNGSAGRRNYSDQVLTRLADRWRFR